MQSLSALWCVGGDFNATLDPSKRVGVRSYFGSMRCFQNFVFQANVVNIPLQGTSFTWSNNRENQAWARLDRFLLSPSILMWFPNLLQRSLPRSLSDHNPVMLCEENLEWGPSPFRFPNWWLEEKEMMKETIKGWKNCKTSGSKGFVLFSKAKAAKNALKRWLKTSKVLLKKPKEVEDKLSGIDIKVETEGWTEALREERLKLMGELWKCLRREEQTWRQKSRINWLMEGYKNTSFFHSVANGRRRRNLISELTIDGVTVTDPSCIRSEIFGFFKEHFKQEAWQRPSLSWVGLKRISKEESLALEANFSGEEILLALSNCDGNKAPGPDGFNINFIKAHWDEIQEDFMNFINDFHKGGAIRKDINRAFIALIPKVGKPESMKDYRPICLVGSCYKLLAKVLANRLKKCMDSIIGETQMAFVTNRQISNSLVIAEEIINKWKGDMERGLIVKLDFEKAYDSVDCNFLDNMMAGMGFGARWRGWIKECVSSTLLSVLVNGRPTSQFGMERGLRQGDPISPLLFNIVVQGLNCLLQKALNLGLIKGENFDDSKVHITHLQFADDTMLFLKPRMEYILNAKRVLDVDWKLGQKTIDERKDNRFESVDSRTNTGSEPYY
ncbi:hypothetical protein Dsin_014291 [Dipteronia sinensis]|uniref:Reverse transcriptase domain-containing protein n=1 Tax=Dipteronia sinensis TaxID=43782 RepID=A0AAE0ALN3_9ROSI|nr:hypothetical protein Dsin_014291 [Dipteronia sinensis]